MKDFKGKVVVITGGSTGIGFSFARKFGHEGAKIIICGLRENRIDEAVQSLRASGIEAEGAVCDVSKREDVETFADFAWDAFGSVDVVMSNAGVMAVGRTVIDSSKEDFMKIFDVNVFGVLNVVSVFGKRLIEQGTSAALYNVGSENSLFNGVPLGAPYVASKHAVLALTESLKEEVPDYIEVGLICPGFVQSELGGDEARESMSHAMDTDRFTSIAMKQIKQGEFYIVSHAYNMVRIDERYRTLKKAYEHYAPRYDGDDEFDVRTLFHRMAEGGNRN